MNALVDFFSLSQNARLVTLACKTQPDVAAALVAEQFTGREGVDELFSFELDALSTEADLDIDVLVGAALSIGLLQPDGSRRAWHGVCTHAGATGADGGVARYRLRIEPALAQLQRRRDSHLFQDMDARAIVADLLADYPDVQCAFDVTRTLAQRAICTQYRESDFAFFCRVLASEGLSWRFDHDADAHRLVVFDASASVPAMPGGAVLRFHGVRATDVDDAIDHWHARRTACANGVALSSWDPQQLVAPSAQKDSRLDAGEVPAMPVYDGSGERIASGIDAPGGDADSHGQLMLQALERDNKAFIGAGAVRRLAAGHGFMLTQHAHFPEGQNGFTVLWVTHAARNNLRTGIKGAASAIADGTYRNRFGCVRDTVALVPPATVAAPPCTAVGQQVALVVGLPDSVATTTRDHQVKIQFAWQRGARPNPGGLQHASVSGGNAPGDASCGAWVRVAEGLAGPNWGSQFIPRIGTEVLVAFIEGDMDRPVIVGQLHNGVAPPPFPAGVDAAANHAGVLSGIHTENFDGGGFNQWQLDDTQDQARMRLASSSAAAELRLGHLVEQSFGASTRGAAQGSGFELRTDAWVVLRGAQGVLLSTSARSGTGSGVTSTQMDAQEAVSLYKGAHALDDALTQSAGQHRALASKEACAAQASLIQLVDPKDKGKYDGPVNGQPAAKARAGSREVDAAQPVERFGAPAVLFDAAASMNWATPASTVLSAGQQVHWTTQADVHVAAGTTISSVAGGSASVFTHAGGIQAIAGNGPVSLEAHTDRLEIVADKEVVALSVNDVITIQAKTKVVLQAGKSSITLDGGDITFACPGNFTAKGGKHILDKGVNCAAVFSALPQSRVAQLPTGIVNSMYDEQIQFKNKHQAILANIKYELKLEDGTIQTGVTDSDGKTERIAANKSLAIVEATLQPTEQGGCCSARNPSQEPLKMEVSDVSTNEENIGTSVVIVQTPEGKSRGLTPGEITAARSIFFDSIDYSKVKIHNGEYLWFGWQPDDTAMTPNGEMYFNPKEFLPDYSTTLRDTLWFMHEMVHVWQYQLGYNVRLRGAIRIGLDYKYTLDDKKTLSSYNMEAQGNLLADYWAIKKLGVGAELQIFEKKHKNDLSLYEMVLKKFISNPSDKTNLPGGLNVSHKTLLLSYFFGLIISNSKFFSSDIQNGDSSCD